MINNAIIVFLGCGVGGVLRFLVSEICNHFFKGINFPIATAIVNIAGCLVIGLIFGYMMHGGYLSNKMRLFLATGICGGFTTFSSYINESYSLWNSDAVVSTILYIAGSIVIGFTSLIAGYYLSRLI